jgi:hypothetical protein
MSEKYEQQFIFDERRIADAHGLQIEWLTRNGIRHWVPRTVCPVQP